MGTASRGGKAAQNGNAAWKMEFNVDKCKIMHMGNSNTEHTYVMGSTELSTVMVWFNGPQKGNG